MKKILVLMCLIATAFNLHSDSPEAISQRMQKQQKKEQAKKFSDYYHEGQQVVQHEEEKQKPQFIDFQKNGLLLSIAGLFGYGGKSFLDATEKNAENEKINQPGQSYIKSYACMAAGVVLGVVYVLKYGLE